MDLITTDQATELEERYIDTRSSVIDSSLGYEDMRSFYLSIDEIKDYIDHIETESATKGYQDIGIGIYLGAKEEDANGQTFATAFITATRDNSDKNSTDIQPLNGFIAKKRKFKKKKN